MKLIFSAALGLAFLYAPLAAAQGDFDPHPVGPPQAPGASPIPSRVDAFMAQNGYRHDPSFSRFGTASGGNSLKSESVSLRPGSWVLAIVSVSDPPCSFAVTYRDTGYTVGREVFSARSADGFSYIPLDVTSNISGIMVQVRAADVSARSGSCTYEYRLYGRS